MNVFVYVVLLKTFFFLFFFYREKSFSRKYIGVIWTTLLYIGIHIHHIYKIFFAEWVYRVITYYITCSKENCFVWRNMCRFFSSIWKFWRVLKTTMIIIWKCCYYQRKTHTHTHTPSYKRDILNFIQDSFIYFLFLNILSVKKNLFFYNHHLSSCAKYIQNRMQQISFLQDTECLP